MNNSIFGAGFGQNSKSSLINLHDVSKVYQLGKVMVPALRGISASIRPGRLTVLRGPSGSGKTTLLNLLGCLDVADSGHIEISGVRTDTLSSDVLSRFRARHIGFVFQNFNLIPVLNAMENVEYPLRLLGEPRVSRSEKVADMLAKVGLERFGHHRSGELSGGQRQRVAIARALVKRPSLLLADEPTANLDSNSSNGVLSLMRDLQREMGTTIVISSHDPDVVSIADDVLTIHDGRIVA